jgi:ABC-2 type transport system ATP-binding protein
VIEVVHLSKSFGPVRALDDINFRVEEGQILGFLGPNGAGKSTTMRILTGFLPGDSGSARIAGFDVATESIAVRRATGYLPEGVPLYPEMRVNEYLGFRARLKGIPRSERRRHIASALEATGVTEVSRRVIGTLSRGYRQRVGLADALLAEPRVLILDEPTVGLDPEQVRQFRQLLKGVAGRRTVILSTHILSEVEMVCSRVVIIHRGKIVAQDNAARIRQRFGGMERTIAEVAGPPAAIREALGGDPRVVRLGVAPGEVYHRVIIESRDGDLREWVYQTVRDRGWSLRELGKEAVSLEDAFVGLVGKAGQLGVGGGSEG